MGNSAEFRYHGSTGMKWCDYNCEEAAFPDEALEGACRTVAAVWCKKLKKLIPKNSPCQAMQEKDEAARRRGRGARSDAR